MEKLREAIKQAKKELDLFNLEVAQLRVKKGMSANLIELYEQMGILDTALRSLNNNISRLEYQFDMLIATEEE